MDEAEAVVARAVAHANEVLQGTTTPYEGAKALWMLEISLEELVDALRVFAGLASEWEDDPKSRSAYDKEIVIQADRFRARFGP